VFYKHIENKDPLLLSTDSITFYQVAQGFLLDRQSQNISRNTIRVYRHELEWFQKYLDAVGVLYIHQVTGDVIRLYLVELEKSRNPGGINVAYRVIKTCTYWWEDETDDQYRSPVHKIKAPKVPRTAIQGVQPDQVKAMLAACHTGMAVRDRAVIRCLFDTGVRKEEFCDLNVGDVDLMGGRVSVMGKGARFRMVFLGVESRKALRSYLRTRGQLAQDSPLFASDEGDRFGESGLRELLERRCRDAGIPIQSPHDFRRGFALECLRNGMDIYTLQHLMGHADLTVLMRYLHQVEMDVSRAFNKWSPGDRL